MAERVRRGCRGDGIDWSVLDPTVRIAGIAWLHRAFGECPPREERLRTQVRCARLSMVTAADELRIAIRGVSTAGRDLRAACGVAATGYAGGISGEAYPAHAKGADADERAAR